MLGIYIYISIHFRNIQVIDETMFYNETLSVNPTNLRKLSTKTKELNEDEVDMYAWIVDGGGDNGVAWLGAACKTGTGEQSKTSLTRGPSRYNAIIETAEVRFIGEFFNLSNVLIFDQISIRLLNPSV